jgi:hypothetical protein
LSHISSPFCIGYFWDEVLLYIQAGLDLDSPIYDSHIAGMTSTQHQAQQFVQDGFSLTSPQAALNYDPSNFCLSVGYD